MSYPGRAIVAPTDLVGCVLWLDGQDSASITRDGSNLVSQWSDKSGNAKHAVQATPANKPTYSATGFNNLPCLDWGASPPAAMGLQTPSISYGAFTAFFVVDGITGGGYLSAHNSGAGQDYIYRITASFYVSRASVASGRNFTALAGSSNWAVGKKCITRRFDGTHAGNFARAQGANLDTANLAGATSDPGISASAGVVGIGNGGAAGTEAWRGKIAEVIFYDRALTDGEVAAVERYLNRKWAMQMPVERAITSPLDIPNCSLWLDAADLSSITKDGSNRVSQWNDKSGNAFHAAQATGARQPLYVANAFNGLPALQGTFAADTMLAVNGATGVPLSSAATYFVVCTKSSTINGYITSDASNTNAFLSAFTSKDFEWYTGASERYTLAASAASGLHVLSIVKTSAIALRGGYDGSTSFADKAFANVANLRSVFNIPTTAAGFGGSIAELVVFNRALSEGERVQVERYLARKWGIVPLRAITSPLAIPNCSLWLDAAQGVTLVSSAVSQWNDQSGNGNHLTQATPGARPAMGTTPNGLPCLVFDGTDDILAVVVAIAQPHTVFVVGKWGSGQGTIFCGGGNLSRFWRVDAVSANFAGAAANALAITGITPDTWHAHGLVFDGVASSYAQDEAYKVRGNAGVAAATGVGVGGLVGFGAPHYAVCSVAEVVVFSRALSEGERSLVVRYLAAKYAL